ncbi:Uncharacterized conserved protein YjgD, DUF1641 family [Carboxydocella sporoproducens DSM 16521]|uniref:Uncharacterized conserved protein YjgD, DUF1641 family n=2 Tax=Carboxydocella TaxID=178898 RepID=A0A1T4Q2X1_9FIRM|nr:MULTISPECIES: DUF1641 domain-containing protein [Carboxydocella]AVX21221.1 Uncharacterized conserved protein YjgD, DUF1641 family [Carboxydocella thermautotrophica]SJZ97548.1 Uncharacterized conserved protein YjgD, DUF1641 family [Carboxydocella sporoproducens DSM 16521]
MSQPAQNVVHTVQNDSEAAGKTNQLLGLINAAIDSMDASVVQNLVSTVVQIGEVADELNTPEMIELLREVQKAGKNLQSLIAEVNKLQESGAFDVLIELVGIVKSVKDSSTAGVVTDILKQVVELVSMLDQVLALGGGKLLLGMINSLNEAIEENKNKQPKSMFAIIRQLNSDPDIKKSVNVLVSFLKKFSAHLNLER